MLQQIIDRRLAGKNKSVGNRERFMRRYKDKIKEAVRRAVDGRGIRDLERGDGAGGVQDLEVGKEQDGDIVDHGTKSGKNVISAAHSARHRSAEKMALHLADTQAAKV